MSRPTPLSTVLAAAIALLAASAAQAVNPITVTSLSLEPTLESLGAVAAYTGDDDNDSRAWLEYRQVGSASFLRGTDMVRLTGKRFASCLIELDVDTPYEVRVVAQDPDNAAPVLLAALTRTRPDQPVPPSGRTWVVDGVTGSDSNPGTETAPLRTIGRAATLVQAGELVLVRPAVYREQVGLTRSGTPTAPITFRASGPGVVIDGSDPALERATWVSEGGFVYSVARASATTYVAVDDARLFPYRSLADLRAENGDMGQPGVLPGGFFDDTVGGRLYVILPDHSSPASHVMHVAVRPHAFFINNRTDVVIDGFEQRYFGNATLSIASYVLLSSRVWVRNNVIHHTNYGVRIAGSTARNNVIENNQVRDTSVFGWPWDAVKGSSAEGTAIGVKDGAANSVRRNSAEGPFNGVNVGFFDSTLEDQARDTEVYDNSLYLQGDDGLEIEGACRNERLWSNVTRQVVNGISIAPIRVGPVYLVRNIVWEYRDHVIKVNNGTTGHVLFYHTTSLPRSSAAAPLAKGMKPSLPFGGLVTRNNIMHANQYVMVYEPTSYAGPNSIDYDVLWTDHPSVFVRWFNVPYGNIAALQQSNTIEQHGWEFRPTYVNAAAGDFTPLAGSQLLDRAALIPGINDRGFAGTGPDLGAIERGASGPVGPDLAFVSFTGPSSASPGSTISVQDQVVNQGNQAAGASVNVFYLSVNTTYDGSDVVLGQRSVPALTPAATSSATTPLLIPPTTPAGQRYLLARADATGLVSESNEGNNVSAAVPITIVAANQPPVVTLTSPPNGATYVAPATVPLAATASDPDGSVARVEFYQGTTLIATDTTAPYTGTWSNVGAGSYTVTAVAIDNLGARTTSAGANITVTPPAANQPPVVTLTSPPSGATYVAPATVPLAATASDPDGSVARVEFYQGTTLIATDTTAPYTGTWSNVGAGSYTVTAVAIDNLGARTTSAGANITVTSPPSGRRNVALAANGGVATASSSAALHGPAGANNGDRIGRSYGNNGGWRDNTADVWVDWLRVDFAGSRTIDEVDVITLQDDPPQAVEPDLNMTFTRSGIVNFEVQQWNGVGWRLISGANPTTNDKVWRRFTFAPITTTAIRILVRNGLDHHSRIVEVEAWEGAQAPANQPPTSSLTSPLPGATYTAPATVTMTAAATDPDGQVIRVDFYQAGSLLGSDTTSPYSYTWPGVAAGAYTLRAVAVDDDGDSTTSTPVDITVTAPGPVNVALASNGATATVSSTFSSAYAAAGAINGDRIGRSWGNGGGWSDATANTYYDWIVVTFPGPRNVREIDVISRQHDPTQAVAPTLTMESDYTLQDFTVQTWNGSAWVMVPNGRATANTKVWRQFTFTPITTTSIRVQISRSMNSYSRVVELEAWQ